MSFHATVVETDQSFISGRFGEEVLDRKLSICEDAHHRETIGRLFDWEGYPKQRTDIIVNGRANAVVYDTISAKKVGGKSTGNALGHDRDKYYSSPMTENLIVQNNSTNIEDMIKKTDYGIYINRFWYVREINFKEASVTGMTRDGTFLIKNGKIDHALHNLRFTVSLVDVFSSIESIGDKLHLSEAPIGTVLTPAMKLSRFFVSGSSVY
jgi:predicted Zn-dependent protease